MKFDLCIGDGEIFWEFYTGEERDAVWENLLKNHQWHENWAEKRGDGTGARSHIILHPENMPMAYRWHCVFE